MLFAGAVEASVSRFQDSLRDLQSRAMATAPSPRCTAPARWGGEEVVVKARRPGIERQMRGASTCVLAPLRGIEATIDEAAMFGVSDIVVEFERGVLQELNFNTEFFGNLTLRR